MWSLTAQLTPSRDAHFPNCTLRLPWCSSYPGNGHITAVAQYLETPIPPPYIRVKQGQDCIFTSMLPSPATTCADPVAEGRAGPKRRLGAPHSPGQRQHGAGSTSAGLEPLPAPELHCHSLTHTDLSEGLCTPGMRYMNPLRSAELLKSIWVQ